ncbi:MAG: S8 family peptidase, partial [Candidatus Eremiobacterota bacterium]
MIRDIRNLNATYTPPLSAGGGRPADPPARPSDSAELSSSTTPLERKLLAVAAEAARLAPTLGEHEEGQVIVKLRSGSGLEDFASSYGSSVAEKFETRGIFQDFGGELLRLNLPQNMSTAEAITLMSKDPRVAYAVPNHVYTLPEDAAATESASPSPSGTNAPNDLDPKLWGLNNTGQDGGTAGADINAPEAWTVSTGKRDGGPLIAVVDTGADYNHPDLKNNIWTNPGEIPGNGIDDDGNGVVDDVHGYNAYANTGDPMDGHSHGTHVSGTIAAEGNNGQGVVGVNWEARIMPVKIFSDSGRTTADAIIRGLLYATRMGARVTSNSWGGGAANEAIKDAFRQSPALHIVAAGNDGKNNDSRPTYPASYDLGNIVAVAATDKNDRLASFSNYGRTSVDVAAPGVGVYSTVPNNGYGNKSGTSMATPHVSGMAALILSAHPELSNEQVKSRLIHSSDKVSALNGKSVSNGRANLARAIETDQVAPAAPNDLRAAASSHTGFTVGWTATGDDSWCGQAAGYELRWSD